MTTTLNVGTRKQLFADRRLIDSSREVRLAMNPPRQTSEQSLILKGK